MKRKYTNIINIKKLNYFLWFLLFITSIVVFRKWILKETLTSNIAASARTPQDTTQIINAQMGSTLIGKIFPEKINPNISSLAYIAITDANRAITNANKAIYDAQISQSKAQARLDSQNATITSSKIQMAKEFSQHYTDQQNMAKSLAIARAGQA